jgi:hypothetical protein
MDDQKKMEIKRKVEENLTNGSWTEESELSLASLVVSAGEEGLNVLLNTIIQFALGKAPENPRLNYTVEVIVVILQKSKVKPSALTVKCLLQFGLYVLNIYTKYTKLAGDPQFTAKLSDYISERTAELVVHYGVIILSELLKNIIEYLFGADVSKMIMMAIGVAAIGLGLTVMAN